MRISRKVRVPMSGLEQEILSALKDTRELTGEALHRAIDKTASETVSRIKEKAPVKTGAYRSGWTSKVTIKSRRGGYGRTIYNNGRTVDGKRCYRLAHLLQNGHGGPRPAGAHPHIPQDDETEALLEKNIESEMSKG